MHSGPEFDRRLLNLRERYSTEGKMQVNYIYVNERCKALFRLRRRSGEQYAESIVVADSGIYIKSEQCVNITDAPHPTDPSRLIRISRDSLAEKR